MRRWVNTVRGKRSRACPAYGSHCEAAARADRPPASRRRAARAAARRGRGACHCSGRGKLRNGLEKKQTWPPKSCGRSRPAHRAGSSSVTTTVLPGLTARPASVPPCFRRATARQQRRLAGLPQAGQQGHVTPRQQSVPQPIYGAALRCRKFLIPDFLRNRAAHARTSFRAGVDCTRFAHTNPKRKRGCVPRLRFGLVSMGDAGRVHASA